MQPADIYSEIQRIFNPDDARSVVMALRHHTTVWNGLLSDNTVQLLSEKAGSQPGLWNPASIVVLNLNTGMDLSSLANEEIPSVDAALKNKAVKCYEDALRNGNANETLESAGLIALALRERRKMTQSWQGIVSELFQYTKGNKNMYQTWILPLAVLVGMIPDSKELFKNLTCRQPLNNGNVTWVCNAIFCNPYSFPEQVSIFLDVLSLLTPNHQMAFLRKIALEGRAELAKNLAQSLLSNSRSIDAILSAKPDWEEMELEGVITRAIELQRLSGLSLLAGQSIQSLSLAQLANDAIRFWLAGNQLQIAEVANLEERGELAYAASEQAVQLSSGLPMMAAELASLDALDALKLDLPVDAKKPILEIENAKKMMAEKDLLQAQALARQAVSGWIREIDRDGTVIKNRFSYSWSPVLVLKNLCDLNLENEAVKLGQAFLRARPADREIIELMAGILSRKNQIPELIDLLELSVLMEPKNVSWRRNLAQAYEGSENWKKALISRKAVLNIGDAGSCEDDAIYMARVAVQVGEINLARESCEKVLLSNPNHGMANAILGKIKIIEGKPEEALSCLNQATTIAPEEAEAWLVLAELLKNLGQTQKMLDTLKAGVLASPNSANLHFALAKAYLASGLLSDALPYLRKAASLAPESAEISLELGRSLHSLGHFSESKAVIETARLRWPQNPQLAFAYGQLLVAIGDRANAVRAFEEALQTKSPEFDWYSSYADALLGTDNSSLLEQGEISKETLEKAQAALEKALDVVPGHFQTRLKLAEIALKKGEYPKAREYYQQLALAPESSSSIWKWRVLSGNGLTAMNLNDRETALTSLREAIQDKPDRIFLQRYLAEAYRDSRMTQEAYQTARYALKLGPDNLVNLTWYANFMQSLGQYREGLNALQCAIQLAPDSPDFLLQMAGLQIQTGDLNGARKSLERLEAQQNLENRHYQSAAVEFLRLQEPAKALRMLNSATVNHGAPELGLLVEIGWLGQKQEQYSQSLDSIQKAISLFSGYPFLYVFESDLLVQLQRYQAAEACLEHALALYEEGPVNQDKPDSQIIPASWWNFVSGLSPIYHRLAMVYRKLGNFRICLENYRSALEQNPDDLKLRAEAVDAALSYFDLDTAKELMWLPGDLETEFFNPQSPFFDHQLEGLGKLIALRARIALDEGDARKASSLLDYGVARVANNRELTGKQIQLELYLGEFQKAEELYSKYVELISSTKENIPVDENKLPEEYHPEGDAEILTRAEITLGLYRWDEARELFEKYAQARPEEPAAKVGLLSYYASAAEFSRISDELEIHKHAPEKDCLLPVMSIEFDRLAVVASLNTDASQMRKWVSRGKAALKPEINTIQALSEIASTPADFAAWMLALRTVGNASQAVKIAERAPETVPVLQQLALCYQKDMPSNGLKAASRAVEIQPHNLLSQIILARLAEASGSYHMAFNAVEQVLAAWETESYLHAWAARLAEECSLDGFARSHWEKAFALEPDHVNFAISLAQVYLGQGLVPEATDLLERISRREPEHGEIWLLLAEAYRDAGKLSDALDAAELAVRIQSQMVEPLLLCGQIALEMKASENALKYARMAKERNAANPDVVLFYSKALVANGQVTEGLDVLDKASSDGDANLDVMLEDARLTQKLRGSEPALKILKSLREQYPSENEVLSELAKVQADCGDLAGAEQTASEALINNSQQPGLNLLMGRIYFKGGQLDQAVSYFTEAIRQNPGLVDGFLELAKVFEARREPAKALQIYQQAVKAHPKDFRPYYQAALVMRENKDYLGAEAMLRKAADLSPQDLNIRRQLGAVIALNLVHNSQEVNSYL